MLSFVQILYITCVYNYIFV